MKQVLHNLTVFKPPSLLGEILCFCTGSTATAGCKFPSCNNFRTTFHVPFFFAILMALTCRIPGYIWLVLVMTLTMNFQDKIFYLLYLSKTWSDCNEMKNKHIDWMSGLRSPITKTWCYQMESFCALLTGEFPAQRPVMRSFDVLFDLHLNKWLSNQLWGWWLEMQPCSLWCHCNEETYQVNATPQMWPSLFTLAMTLTLKNWVIKYNAEFVAYQEKMVWLPWNKKHIDKECYSLVTCRVYLCWCFE